MGYIRWGREELGLDVWEAAKDRVRSALGQFDNYLVSFSGGKDSTVTLLVTLEVAEEMGRLPVRAVFYDEEAIPYETEDYARRVAADPRVEMEWYCLPVKHRNACAREEPHWWPWAPEARDLWCRPLPPEAITELDGFPVDPGARPSMPASTALLSPPARGTCVQLLGIRADESLTRRKAVGNAREENWLIRDATLGPHVAKAYPIYDMNTADVWTAIAAKGADHNQAYDLMDMAGITPSAQRCAPPYGEQPMQKLWVFKVAFPDLWERMQARVPGAATAALYSTTSLYAFGDVPAKPDGVTWQEFIARRLREYDDEKVRTYIAYRIRSFIQLHYRKTSEPLLSVPHPESGISWAWLYKLADRGDLKERTWPDYNADRGLYEACWLTEEPGSWASAHPGQPAAV